MFRTLNFFILDVFFFVGLPATICASILVVIASLIAAAICCGFVLFKADRCIDSCAPDRAEFIDHLCICTEPDGSLHVPKKNDRMEQHHETR